MIGDIKLQKGIETSHDYKTYIARLAAKSVPVSKANINNYLPTFENYPPYQRAIEQIQNGSSMQYFERAYIYTNFPHGESTVIFKQFAFVNKNSPDGGGFLARDIDGSGGFAYSKLEFYNSYGEKTGEWFGNPEGRASITYDGNYMLLIDAGGFSDNGMYGARTTVYLDKFGRLIKRLDYDSDPVDKYYCVSRSRRNYRPNAPAIDISILSPESNIPLIRFIHQEKPGKGYNISVGSPTINDEGGFAEGWNIATNKRIIMKYSLQGKLISTETVNWAVPVRE